MNFEWFVVYCNPLKESIAAAHIQQQGFEIYMPKYKKIRRHARKTETVFAPLFPRYIFVNLDRELSNWAPINNTPGVSYLLKNKTGLLSIVPTNVIQELQKNHDSAGLVSLSVLELFKPGDRVRILDGAFAHHTAVYEKMTDDQRVQLLINLIQREVKITMPLYALEKI